jgi:hypothetical protein
MDLLKSFCGGYRFKILNLFDCFFAPVVATVAKMPALGKVPFLHEIKNFPVTELCRFFWFLT